MFRAIGNRIGRMGAVESTYLKRWPKAPKVAFFGPPNAFVHEIAMR